MKLTSCLKVLAAAGPLIPALAFGASYIESVNGDISGNRLSPTFFSLTSGANTFTATSVSGDIEYLTFSIPSGFVFQSLTLDAFSPASGLSFIGIQSGATFTEPATGTNVANLLGYTHFSNALVGTNILDDIGTGPGAMGFTPPLSSGNYTFWIQETGGTPRTYTFTLDMAPVPEPSSLALCFVGFLAAWIGCREFRKRGGSLARAGSSQGAANSSFRGIE